MLGFGRFKGEGDGMLLRICLYTSIYFWRRREGAKRKEKAGMEVHHVRHIIIKYQHIVPGNKLYNSHTVVTRHGSTGGLEKSSVPTLENHVFFFHIKKCVPARDLFFLRQSPFDVDVQHPFVFT